MHHHTPLSVLRLIFASFGHPAFSYLEKEKVTKQLNLRQ